MVYEFEIEPENYVAFAEALDNAMQTKHVL
jgi:hypothetical protein